jgi:uncharacterized membrane protein
MDAIAGVLLLAVSVAVYITPMLLALRRKHRNTNAITVVNILLGWTVIGWIIALAWAVSYSEPAAAPKAAS